MNFNYQLTKQDYHTTTEIKAQTKPPYESSSRLLDSSGLVETTLLELERERGLNLNSIFWKLLH
jgi:hypothetical protein